LFRLSAQILDRTFEFVPCVAVGAFAGTDAGMSVGETEGEGGLFVD
jgi:hypothetical protein